MLGSLFSDSAAAYSAANGLTRWHLKKVQPISNLVNTMKIFNSLKAAKKRDKNCKLVRRKGRLFVINKLNPRFKARQG